MTGVASRKPKPPRCPACGRVLLLVWGRDVCCNVACPGKR
jgi:hypothetical protein